MSRRSLLTSSTRQELFGIPEGPEHLVRYYTLNREDHDLIRTRRRNENRLGLGLHIALLRQPEQALSICVRFPNLPAAGKFFCERAGHCLPSLSEMIAGGEESEDVYYAAGISSQINQHWDQAEEWLKMDLEITTDPSRTEDIRARLNIIADDRA